METTVINELFSLLQDAVANPISFETVVNNVNFGSLWRCDNFIL